jgi:hypothetical protein
MPTKVLVAMCVLKSAMISGQITELRSPGRRNQGSSARGGKRED